jgi:hypothetical protein
MPHRRFALERSGPKRLKVSWRPNWIDLQVSLDGLEVGRLADKTDLKFGRDFDLPDGSKLRVQLTNRLVILRDGKPLPGSPTDPATILALSSGLIFFIGGGNTLVGLLAEVIGNREFSEIFGWPDVLGGLVFLALGFGVRKRSRSALGLAVALLAVILMIRGVGTLAAISQGTRAPGMGGIVLGIIFLIQIAKGFRAIRELEAQEAVEGSLGSSADGVPTVTPPTENTESPLSESKCSFCSGTGKLGCWSCQGKGKMGGTLGIGQKECSLCSGTGVQDCANCTGTGRARRA